MSSPQIAPPPGYTLDGPASGGITPPPGYKLDAPQSNNGTTDSGSFTGNLIKSAGDAASGLFNAITHPVETGKNLAGVLSTALTGTGMMQAVQGDNPHATALQSHFMNRYGSIDAAKKTAYEDPVGFAMDAAQVLGPLAEVGDVFGAVPKTLPASVGVDAGKAALRASAEQDYAKALNPTTRANKAITTNQLAPGLADRGVVASSLSKVKEMAETKASDIGDKIDDFFDAKAKQGATLPAQPIIDRLEQYAKKSQVVNPKTGVVTELDPALASTIDELKKQVQSVADPQSGEVPMENLRQIRQYYDGKLQGTKDWALDANQRSQVEAARQLPNAIRGSLADAYPELADLNAEYSFHKNLAKVAGDTLDRTQGQKPSLTVGIAKAMGAASGAHGGPLAALGAAEVAGKLAKFQQSFLWKSLSAQTKMKVADMISSGNPQAALKVANQAALAANATAQSSRTAPSASVPAQQ